MFAYKSKLISTTISKLKPFGVLKCRVGSYK